MHIGLQIKVIGSNFINFCGAKWQLLDDKWKRDQNPSFQVKVLKVTKIYYPRIENHIFFEVPMSVVDSATKHE